MWPGFLRALETPSVEPHAAAFYRGVECVEDGLDDEAIDAYREAIALAGKPSLFEAHYNLGLAL